MQTDKNTVQKEKKRETGPIHCLVVSRGESSQAWRQTSAAIVAVEVPQKMRLPICFSPFFHALCAMQSPVPSASPIFLVVIMDLVVASSIASTSVCVDHKRPMCATAASVLVMNRATDS
ncbi:hypothetical protein TraAM80_05416 [Trypanosoma rangeli]|uniref:Uncharacterized protein n=1 Tax=Trypanosoma rangeli TaxID=5698 RepID=A0A3R7NKF9_TRYRA|nr:uncharacterized protein TraAM80_05416 [Trypanosoma rangeli]RNF03962.1 hypothetical protein TraAM80_05416 [Trypanosoma rangeli]|eukprot:RNF03962.1 hypothetical protein TraAM80_05416 [Trypanosoma rangeli]